MVDSVVAPLVRPVVEAVDVDDVVHRIDVDELLDRIDIDALLDRVDPDALLDRIDVNRLLDRVEIDRLLDRIDADRLLDRVDVDRVVERVDPNAVVDRVDVNAVMARVDVNALVQRTELGEIIARSTTGVFGQLLDLARAAVMSIDLAVQGAIAWLLHRRDPWGQRRPGATLVTTVPPLPVVERAVALQGHYAGSVSRFCAFLVDTFVAGVLFTAGTGLGLLAVDTVVGVDWVRDDHRLTLAVAYLSWQFLYLAVPTGLTGRTIGKAALGLRVVDRAGTDVGFWHAVLRTAFFPISFTAFGLGLLLGLLRLDRRQLHDLVGGTAVVYSWDAEVACLRAGGGGRSAVGALPTAGRAGHQGHRQPAGSGLVTGDDRLEDESVGEGLPLPVTLDERG